MNCIWSYLLLILLHAHLLCVLNKAIYGRNMKSYSAWYNELAVCVDFDAVVKRYRRGVIDEDCMKLPIFAGLDRQQGSLWELIILTN